MLPFAIISGQAEFALFLLEQGADPNGAMDGVRALHVAAGNVDDLARRLVAHGTAVAGLGGACAARGSIRRGGSRW